MLLRLQKDVKSIESPSREVKAEFFDDACSFALFRFTGIRQCQLETVRLATIRANERRERAAILPRSLLNGTKPNSSNAADLATGVMNC